MGRTCPEGLLHCSKIHIRAGRSGRLTIDPAKAREFYVLLSHSRVSWRWWLAIPRAWRPSIARVLQLRRANQPVLVAAMTDRSQANTGASSTAPAARRAQPRRSKNWMIVLSLSIAGGAAALAGFSPWLFSQRSSATLREAASESLPTGTIAESDADVCKRLTFDDHGQVVRDVVPCDGSVRDAHGQPVPAGTIQRLNAISKSFAGH
jgi:hypothetical protein